MTDFAAEIRQKGYIIHPNKGDSMMPLLRENRDLMVIGAVKGPLRKNDAVLFRRENGSYVLHRIIKVLGDGRYRICGDNRIASEVISEKQIIGILTGIIRDGTRMDLTDREYTRYLRALPHRRRIRILKSIPYRIVKKCRHIFRRRRN